MFFAIYRACDAAGRKTGTNRFVSARFRNIHRFRIKDGSILRPEQEIVSGRAQPQCASKGREFWRYLTLS
jgi:hypothetical protein